MDQEFEDKIKRLEKKLCCKVQQYESLVDFPDSGKTGTLYIDSTNEQIYFWNGTEYIASADPNTLYGTRIDDNTVTGSYNIDWELGSVWDITLTGNTTLVDVNLPTSTSTKVITLLVTGNFTLNFPLYWSPLPDSDTYLGTGENYITIDCINGTSSSEIVYYTIRNI